MTGIRRLVPATLRGRLLAHLVLIVAAGLVGTDLVLYHVLSSHFEARAGRQLERTAAAVVRTLPNPQAPQLIDGYLRQTTGRGLSVLVLGDGDRVLAALPRTGDGRSGAVTDHLAHLRRHPGRSVDLDIAGTPAVRVLYQPTTGQLGAGGSVTAVVVVRSFDTEEETLDRLATAEAIVGAVAMIMLTGLGAVLLRVGLRPLSRMAEAAAVIADGGPVRRVPVDLPHSEAGRLAVALNRALDARHRAEEHLRRFLTDASHELRTPLTTIRGWADLYFQGGLRDPDDLDNALGRIAAEADHLSRLVEELLLLARLDQQRPLARHPVDLATLVSEIVSDARVIDPTRPITLSIPDAADETTVPGDPHRLGQVVRNLVGNALHHTPPGTALHVRLQGGGKGTPVHLTVADDGPGIPAAAQPHVFERFYRAASPREHAGTGLGLAIAAAIVRAHGGSIGLVSHPDDGTRFTVELPGHPGEEPGPPTRRPG